VGKLLGMPVGSAEDVAFARAVQADLTTVADDIFALKAGLAEALANLGGR
jgi:hypothetical protein